MRLHVILLLAACRPATKRAPLDEPGAMMLDPTRVDVMQPGRIVKRVAPRPTDVVVDFGAGPGAFTHEFARAVPQGRVLAVDVNAVYLARVAHDAAVAHETNVDTRAVKVGETGLADGSADVIFLCQVDHYFADPRVMLDKLARALRPGGRVVIVNYLRSERSIDEIAAALGWQRRDAWTPVDGFFARAFSPTAS